MVIEDQFRLMVKRHEGLIRSVCVGFSRGDMELCSDLMQEAVTGMWLRFTHREARMFAAAQGVWVYWQTHHFASQALRRWKTGSMAPGDVPDVAVEESAEEALALELAADLAGRERQLFDLLRQGYRNEEMAERLGLSLATTKRVRASMLVSMRRRAVALGMTTDTKHNDDGEE